MKTPAKRPPRKPAKQTVRVLFSCVGRRVELVRAFRRAGERLGLDLQVHGADASKLSPAMHFVDRAHVVPAIYTGQYVDALLGMVRRQKIHLLIPLLDTELAPLAETRERFAEIGCNALISSPQTVSICNDKLATFRALSDAGIDTPQTWPWVAILEEKQHRFPYYMKPRHGSAAKGNYVIHNLDELRVLGQRVPEPIVQEFVPGEEYTLDVYTGLDGVCRCVVPRKRLEVRTGEVSKGITVRNREIMAVGKRVAEMLKECRGVITVQVIVTAQRRIRVIEMNPRFGGGAPLAIHAGADFPQWILEEFLGRRPRIGANCFRDAVAMLRFDDSVFVANASRLAQSHKSDG